MAAQNSGRHGLVVPIGLVQTGQVVVDLSHRSLDAKWVKACKLYRTNELTGISYLKASTAKAFPDREKSRYGVIIFFCGPHENEDAVMKYGRNLV